MIRILVDSDAIKQNFGSFAFYARKNNLNITELSQTRLYMKESNASLKQLIKDGFVKVKEVKEEEIA